MIVRILLAAVVSLAASPATGEDDAGKLRWMAGCWESKSGSRLIEERWTQPRGGLMLGVSRTSRNDSIVEFEQVRVETRSNGVYYVASPSRQATAEFRATSILDSSAVFENPAHDFPRKITYRRAGPDSLVASIEGPRGGTTRRIAYPFRRVSCDAS